MNTDKDRAGPVTVPSSDGAAATRPAAEPQSYGLVFSGSGSEYFRIWIVNLLLTLVTLGLYYPWAKVRKLRYFYGNTALAGHAFDFHGDPWRMLRGYLLVGALFAAYALAGRISPLAGLLALVIVAALWPMLLCASMRFRLAQTSWRGLRFHFNGDVPGAYRAVVPGFLPIVVLVAVMALAMPEQAAQGQAAQAPSGLALTLLALSMLAVFASGPLAWWLIKRYQHNNYQFASVRTRWTASLGQMFGLQFKIGGVALLALIAGAAAAALLGFASAGALRGNPAGAIFAGVVAVFAIYGVLILVVQPYAVSRLQNLVWSRTESRSIGFDSALAFLPLARQTFINWFLVLLTLGLYWPFAAIATARLRLQAVTVLARSDLDGLVARARGGNADASGDAAADLFGIDVGL
jgi:uncharacterized membrane protein YjgN (DUF898 family)